MILQFPLLLDISATGNNVYVVWSDATLSGLFTDVLFRASINNGQTFGTTSHIRDNASSNNFNP